MYFIDKKYAFPDARRLAWCDHYAESLKRHGIEVNLVEICTVALRGILRGIVERGKMFEIIAVGRSVYFGFAELEGAFRPHNAGLE